VTTAMNARSAITAVLSVASAYAVRAMSRELSTRHVTSTTTASSSVSTAATATPACCVISM